MLPSIHTARQKWKSPLTCSRKATMADSMVYFSKSASNYPELSREDRRRIIYSKQLINSV
jgi:hypothetical protein